MALSVPQPRPWAPGAAAKRFLLVGLAAIVAVAGSSLYFFGNQLTNTQKALIYPTSVVRAGTLQVTVSATGPISNAINFPVSFKSSGKLGELDGSLGQTIAAGEAGYRRPASRGTTRRWPAPRRT